MDLSLRALALAVVVALLAGCTLPATRPPEPETRTVEAPVGTEWAKCPPSVSRPIALAFRSNVTDSTGERGPGIHRLDPGTFLWVYAHYEEPTLREDRVTRVNAVDVAKDVEGVIHVCTRVDVATPTTVDAEPRSYSVAVLLSAQEPLPEGPTRVTVNWVAGCPCSPLPRGNATALFD